MKKVAKFSKVSFEQFYKDYVKCFEEDYHDVPRDEIRIEAKKAYNSIKLPKRGTKGSAGYDFFAPLTVSVRKNDVITMPTGIRCEMNPGWVLLICPRSGMGFKTGIRLANTTGVIDGDYAYSDNEGHIIVKYVNDCAPLSDKEIVIEEGQGFCQGIFVPFGITVNDEVDKERNGGFGSTDAEEYDPYCDDEKYTSSEIPE